MWGKLIASWRIPLYAIWGKLPGHADFVRSGMRAESAFWQQDAEGRFIGAANKLQKLWGRQP
jgi:hypothetical protein